MKVCLVGSSGGHLTHLYMLNPFWKNKDRFGLLLTRKMPEVFWKMKRCIPVIIRLIEV